MKILRKAAAATKAAAGKAVLNANAPRYAPNRVGHQGGAAEPAWLDLRSALDVSSRKSNALPEPLRRHTKRATTVAFCSLSRLYLPKARIFAESLKRFHPDWEYHIIINDAWPEDEGIEIDDIDLVVPIRHLSIDRFHSWVFGMDAEELCCATRPYYFRDLMEAGYERVFFFDPDIEVFAPLDPLVDMLDSYSVLLTPHMDKPAHSDAEILYSEMSVLAHGVYNLGFLGARNDANGRAVIDFWKHRLTRYSLKEHARGLWTDQKWFNLVPVYFDGVHVLRHQGCNVASGNISGRPVTEREGRYFAGEDELLFFHFSGYDRGVPKRMFEVFRQFNPVLEELFALYQRKHKIASAATPISEPRWAFSQFDNGAPLPWSVRKFYRDTLDHRLMYRDPFFAEADPSFYQHARHTGFDWIAAEYDPPGKLRRYF